MIVVKWRHDGDYLGGATAEEGFVWVTDRAKAAKFDDVRQFRRFERAANESFFVGHQAPWSKADVAFVRVK